MITGASSGLGRATALELARRGATLLLGARRADELDETVRLCEKHAGNAFAVPTDVTSEEQVRVLAETALGCTGRIDVWINNAGVTLFAPLEEGRFEEHQRVIETNLFGAIFGARAVLPIFRMQHRGVLINVGSVLSKVGQAFVPSYVISKFGLHGLSEALRVEVADEPDIHVCTFLPYAIDTQHFQAGANHMGVQARAMPPVQTSERAARAVVSLAERPRRERYMPRSAALFPALHVLLPRTTERLLRRALEAWHFDSTSEPLTSGNLYTPALEPAAMHGHRPPLLSSVRLALWSGRELVRMAVEAVQRRLGALRAAGT